MRIYTDKPILSTHEVTGEAHMHLSVVMRAKIGDSVDLCNGDGYVYKTTVSQIKKDKTLLQIKDRQTDFSDPSLKCDLFFAPTKNDYKFLLQKSVELGINSFHPFISQHSVVKSVNVERLNAISAAAAGQCGRNKPPTMYDIIDFFDMLTKIKCYDLMVFPYENAGASIKNYLQKAKQAMEYPKEELTVAIIIGAEGGFSAAEADLIARMGATPLSLGERILRAETAAISTLTVVMYEFDQFSRNDKAENYCDKTESME